MRKRKICVVVQSRANYARIKSALRAIKNHSKLELQLIVGASAVLHKYGKVVDVIESDGFTPTARLYSIIEGENPLTMAKSTGLGIIELATLFDNLAPDIVVTVADRFETMATAIAATYLNIPLAHTQGGEVTGSIDESVRHAVTKLAHVHFPATTHAAENVLRLGEAPGRVFQVGCPSIDLLVNLDRSLPPDFFSPSSGVGPTLNHNQPFLVVLQHPVTTEYGDGVLQIRETLAAVDAVGIQTVWLWPNVDAGSDEISKGLRVFREQNPQSHIRFYRNFPAEDYARLISNCAALIGNSSSALREGAFLGVPAVNIGSRQKNREHASNVIHTDHDRDAIRTAIEAQVSHGPYPSSGLFGSGSAGDRIAEVLADVEIDIQKELTFPH